MGNSRTTARLSGTAGRRVPSQDGRQKSNGLMSQCGFARSVRRRLCVSVVIYHGAVTNSLVTKPRSESSAVLYTTVLNRK